MVLAETLFMEHIEKSVDVNAPLSVVYNQWTQFEDFPLFMDGIVEVKQLDAKRLHWKAKIGGREKEWDAEIFDQTPDERIAWRSTSGVSNAGRVGFQSLGPTKTRVNLKINYDPDGVLENFADALGVVSMRVQSDLVRFKDFIESRNTETGGWRGEIHGREVQSNVNNSPLNPSQPRSQRLRTEDETASSTVNPVANQNASGKMG